MSLHSLREIILLSIWLFCGKTVRGNPEGFVQNCTVDVMDYMGNDFFLSSVEYTNYITALCREGKLCNSSGDVEFSNLPILLQMQFVMSSISYSGGTSRFTDNHGEDIGLNLTDTKNMTESIEKLCTNIHRILTQENHVSTLAPTSYPTISVSPSYAPSINIHLTHASSTNAVPFIIGSTIVTVAAIASVVGISFYRREKRKKNVLTEKNPYHLNSPKTYVSSPASSPSSQERQQQQQQQQQQQLQQQDTISTLSKTMTNTTASETSPKSISLTNSNAPTSSLVPEIVVSTPDESINIAISSELDSYDGDFSASEGDVDCENPDLDFQKPSPMIIETESRSSSSSSSPQHKKRVPPVTTKSWYPFRKKSFKKLTRRPNISLKNISIQQELALQEDSSVSSWSQGSSPHATYLKQIEQQSLYVSPGNSLLLQRESNSVSSISNDDISDSSSWSNDTYPISYQEFHDDSTHNIPSDESAKSLRDDLDRAIESGDWNTVQAHAALIIDNSSTPNDTMSTDEPTKSENFHSSPTSSISTKGKEVKQSDAGVGNPVETNLRKGLGTSLKDVESVTSSCVRMKTDDYPSCVEL